MEKRLIITISLGNRPWFGKIEKYYKLYSKKTNSDFIIINDNYEGDIKSRIRKFEIVKYLDTYDRILFLDDTCIINPKCPNIFDLVDPEYLGVCCENPPFFSKYKNLIESLKYYNVNTNINENNYVWFNSGLILFSKFHKNLFITPSQPIKKIGSYLDQALFNANRYKYNIPFINLGIRYNYMGTLIEKQYPYKFDDITNIYIWHITRAWKNSKRLKKFDAILNVLNKYNEFN